MQKRRWIALITALLAVALLAGCASAPAPAQPPAPPAPSSQTQSAVQYPLSVVDSLGRTVTLPQQPQRILSLAPSNTEILFALGLGDKIVGTDNFSDYPEEAKAKDKVGGLIDPNPEMMLALKPDVAFAIGGSDKQYAKLLEQNIPVVVLQPKTLNEVYDTIRLAGRVTGVPDKADAVVKQMQDRIAAVVDKTKGLTDAQRPGVFYEVYHDPLMTVGPGSFIHDLIGLAGGRNVAEKVGKDYAEVSPELLVQQNPDLIISPYADFIKSVKDGKYPAWAGVTAVKKNQLFQVDDNMMSRPGPRLADALQQMGRIIHPELFK